LVLVKREENGQGSHQENQLRPDHGELLSAGTFVRNARRAVTKGKNAGGSNNSRGAPNENGEKKTQQ